MFFFNFMGTEFADIFFCKCKVKSEKMKTKGVSKMTNSRDRSKLINTRKYNCAVKQSYISMEMVESIVA